MEQYNFNKAKYGTHNLIAKEIGKDKLILDVGCSKGYLKQLAPNNIFYGADNDKGDLEIAKNKNGYQETIELDLNNYGELKIDKKFDVIIFADVLEHLLFPEKILMFFVNNYLKKDGKVIISLPNVAHLSIRLGLLLGRFNYTESGILDRSHLHLYTLKTAEDMIEKCELKIIENKFSSNRLGLLIKKIPALGCLLGYNLILLCQKKY